MLQLGFHISHQLHQEGKEVTPEIGYIISLAVDAALTLQADSGTIEENREKEQIEGPPPKPVMDELAEQLHRHLPENIFPPVSPQLDPVEEIKHEEGVLFSRNANKMAAPQIAAQQRLQAPPDPFAQLRSIIDASSEFKVGELEEGWWLFLLKKEEEWIVAKVEGENGTQEYWSPVDQEWIEQDVAMTIAGVWSEFKMTFEVAWDLAHQLLGGLSGEKKTELVYGQIRLLPDRPPVELKIKQFPGMHGVTWAVIARHISTERGVLESSMNRVGGWEPILNQLPAPHTLWLYEAADHIARALMEGRNSIEIAKEIKAREEDNDNDNNE
jgi:hypothetical protein